ncbi:MAG: hypothetical protein ACOYOH_26005 [Paracraurococcus sp.]
MLSDSPLLPARQDMPSRAESLPDGWLALRRCRLEGAVLPLILLHPTLGIALVGGPAEGPTLLRARLAAARFAAIFPGTLPVLRLDHAEDPAAAFATLPPMALPGGDAWVGVVRRALETEPGPAPRATRRSWARRRRVRRRLGLLCGAAVVALAALGGWVVTRPPTALTPAVLAQRAAVPASADPAPDAAAGRPAAPAEVRGEAQAAVAPLQPAPEVPRAAVEPGPPMVPGVTAPPSPPPGLAAPGAPGAPPVIAAPASPPVLAQPGPAATMPGLAAAPASPAVEAPGPTAERPRIATAAAPPAVEAPGPTAERPQSAAAVTPPSIDAPAAAVEDQRPRAYAPPGSVTEPVAPRPAPPAGRATPRDSVQAGIRPAAAGGSRADRCRSIIQRLQLGDPVVEDDIRLLQRGCQG